MKDLLYDVGFNDGKYHAMVSRKPVKNYLSWQGMLRRCYDKKWQTRNPTYFGCSVSENFKSYSYYHEWCLSQIGFNGLDFQLDKDLLCKGNKVYSEDNCVFLPQEINKLLTTKVCEKMGIPLEKQFYNMSKYGNLAGSSVLVALHDAMEENLIKKDSKVALNVVGGGLTWGAILLGF